MAKEYLVPVSQVTVENQVKKSVFICRLIHAPDREHCIQFIKEIQTRYSDANHNCWAFIAGPPEDPSNWAMNDDGEPKGCAGKPMFNVLQHSGIGEICAVVTRYFGGVKLGTGGMARAYSTSVQLGLDQLETKIKRSYLDYSVSLPYPLLKDIEHLLQENDVVITDRDYGEEVKLIFKLIEGTEKTLAARLQSLTKGNISMTSI